MHRALGITVTPKVHLLETHASEFLEMMGGEHGTSQARIVYLEE